MGQFIGGGGSGGSGSGSGTVTHTGGALTNNAAVFGNGGADIKVDSAITTDGSGDLTAVTFTASGAGTGAINLTTGAMTAGAAGQVKVGANTGNVLSVSANGGAVTAVALTASPTLTTPTFSGNIGGTLQLGTQALTSQYPNDGATGTTVNLLAKLNSSGNVILPLTTDQVDIIGVCVSGCGTSGNAQIATTGEVTCIADNAVTAGDYIGVGTTTAGRCKSISAAGTYPGATLMVVGKAQTAAAAGATFTLAIDPPSQTGPISSATLTSNTILKGGGVGVISVSSITDDATNVNFSEPIKFSITGSASANAIQGDGTAGLGIDFPNTTSMCFSSGSGHIGCITSGKFFVGSGNAIGFASTSDPNAGSLDTEFTRSAAAVMQQGAANAAAPVAQTLQAQGSRGGTDTNVAGATYTMRAGIGTGNAAATKFAVQRNLMGASGTTAQSTADAFVVCESKTLSNTSATAQALANVGLASNSAGGSSWSITVTCTDGTNFDADTISYNQSWVNKAGAITFGTLNSTASTSAANSGSCTIGATTVANGNSVDLKVTPVFTTIVPTTVTGYITLRNNGAGAVTCQ